MSFIMLIVGWWDSHGTKILAGMTTAIPALLAIDGLIPKGQVKWWLAAGVIIGLLTFNRGFTNSSNLEKPQ